MINRVAFVVLASAALMGCTANNESQAPAAQARPAVTSTVFSCGPTEVRTHANGGNRVILEMKGTKHRLINTHTAMGDRYMTASGSKTKISFWNTSTGAMMQVGRAAPVACVQQGTPVVREAPMMSRVEREGGAAPGMMEDMDPIPMD